MKIVTLILVVLTGALAFASVHLYGRLDAERARADAETALRQTWENRAKELERSARGSRSGDNTRTAAIPGPGTEAAASGTRSQTAEPGTPESASPERRREQGERVRAQRERLNPYSTPQGREVMRAQVRASNKRLYADLLKKLKLTPEETDAFLNVLADQQEREYDAMMTLARESGRPDRAARQRIQNEIKAQTQTDLANRLGSARAEQYATYQATLGERMQVTQYADQLDALNLPMKEDQKERFITAMVEEKSATPEPEMTTRRDSQGREARLDWQEDYNRRLLDRASSFLSSEQHRHIQESLDWQLNMQRQQNELMKQNELNRNRQRQRSAND